MKERKLAVSVIFVILALTIFCAEMAIYYGAYSLSEKWGWTAVIMGVPLTFLLPLVFGG